MRDQRTPTERIEAVCEAAGLRCERGRSGELFVCRRNSEGRLVGWVTIRPKIRILSPGFCSRLDSEKPETGAGWPERLAQRAVEMLRGGEA